MPATRREQQGRTLLTTLTNSLIAPKSQCLVTITTLLLLVLVVIAAAALVASWIRCQWGGSRSEQSPCQIDEELKIIVLFDPSLAAMVDVQIHHKPPQWRPCGSSFVSFGYCCISREPELPVHSGSVNGHNQRIYDGVSKVPVLNLFAENVSSDQSVVFCV